MSQESNFNYKIKSKTFDYGLMQINKIWNPDMSKVYQVRYNLCFAYDKILLPAITKSKSNAEVFAKYNGSRVNVNKYMNKLRILQGV
jgi:soluble lytic murein transglycosylase-like protein